MVQVKLEALAFTYFVIVMELMQGYSKEDGAIISVDYVDR